MTTAIFYQFRLRSFANNWIQSALVKTEQLSLSPMINRPHRGHRPSSQEIMTLLPSHPRGSRLSSPKKNIQKARRATERGSVSSVPQLNHKGGRQSVRVTVRVRVTQPVTQWDFAPLLPDHFLPDLSPNMILDQFCKLYAKSLVQTDMLDQSLLVSF